MPVDYHIHTSYSLDSEFPMEEVVKRAILLGLSEICFTEHLDYFENGEHHLVDYPRFFAEIETLRHRYAGKIIIRAGAEFGVQIGQIPRFEKVYPAYPFDFILLSNHEVGDLEFWNGHYQAGKKQGQYNRDYYRAIYEVIQQFKHYSVLSHLDMIKRYDPAGILPDKENEDLIKAILKTAISDGKGIEINTSCFRYGLPDLTPSRDILSWYRQLGGRIITMGSDTHREQDLGFRMKEAGKALEELGFREYTTFSGMEPEFHLLSKL